MKLVHFMLVIAYVSFEMSTWKLKVALYGTRVDNIKWFAESLSYLSFGTVDV